MPDTPVRDPAQPDSLSPKTQAILSLVQGLLPAMTAVIGGLWIVLTYVHDQTVAANKDAENRAAAARQPYLTQKLGIHMETAAVIGQLDTILPDNPEWEKSNRRFWELYWSELSVVEDKTLATTMSNFKDALLDLEQLYGKPGEPMDPKGPKPDEKQIEARKASLLTASLHVAEALRDSLERDWKLPSN